ncbi:hypothetical protein [Marinicellulosiphila megalodicopiae]|uniref:hypothetical protein n=1 Tax=Marinicellulosiphila megalodicopiae TaxID=2724896 RepID=UPI003BB21B56
MGFIKFFIILLFIAFGIGVLSKPDEQSLKDMYYQKILNDVQQINEDDNLLSGALKVACILTKDDCAQSIVDNLNIQSTDYFAMKLAKVQIQSNENICLGVFNTWKCF